MLHLPSGPTTAEAVTSPDNCTVNPGVPVPSMLSTALSSAPSEGWVITGPARSETLTEREAAPGRLKPFTVSAENWNRPVVDGAGKDQLPTASTGTSSGGWPATVMRTFELAATAEAGAAGTRPVMGVPAVKVPFAGATGS